MTREEWLRHAIEELDTRLFNGDLDLMNHGYRVTWGRCPGKKLTETVQPYDGEDVRLDDFFPTTISVSYTLGDPLEILGALALECIHAFFNIKTVNKQFKRLAEKYYFDAPYTSFHSTPTLHDVLVDVYSALKEKYGEWPEINQPVVFHKSDKEPTKNTLTIFCPSCGIEYRVNKKKFEKAGSLLPTCGCGAHMGVDHSDDELAENTEE